MASSRAVANGSEVGMVSQVSPRLALGASPGRSDPLPHWPEGSLGVSGRVVHASWSRRGRGSAVVALEDALSDDGRSDASRPK